MDTLFSDKSYNARSNAQINLDGKTHYVDNATMRYFGSKILASSDHANGRIFALCESLQAGFDASAGRVTRYVAFDLFGTVIYHPDIDASFKTREKARKAFYVWFEAFDVDAHYRAAMLARADSLEREAQDLRNEVQSWK